jgi:branched-chain amino acid transport system ATP-binding protein
MKPDVLQRAVYTNDEESHGERAGGAGMRAETDMSLLHLDNVSRHFGSLKAVQEVTFEMAPGELRAVIGPNGAGKTTFFNLITGFFPCTSGKVWFDGENISALPVPGRVGRGIVRTFQITEVFPDLTVFENIRLSVETEAGVNARPWLPHARRVALDRRVDELIHIVDLENKADRVVNELAHGDQRVVEVALALSMNPRLLMLDEPTAGMGDNETDHMVELVRRLHAEQGLSILFIEHDMNIVFGIAERITVLDQGKKLAEGTAAEISANEQVRVAYLGEEAE